MDKIIRWWQTPKFPLVHLDDPTSLVKKWLFHPIKRRIAKYYLMFLQRFTDIKVIAITGSAGKTTTKEFLVSILKTTGRTSYSKANIDPVYNIPTTILSTKFGTKFLVLEMGIEYPNEMDFYLWLASPDIGVITNIFPTHLKFMGDTNGVLTEKSKLVTSLSSDKIAVLYSGDKLLKTLKKHIKAKILWVDKTTDPFRQNGYTASFVAKLLGVSTKNIKKGINNFEKPNHRMNWLKLKSGTMIFDDSYNSNPLALIASLKPFIKRAGKNAKVAVIGDMLELGEKEIEYHKEIGKIFAKSDFQAVIGVGNLTNYLLDEITENNKYTKTYHTKDLHEANQNLKQYLTDGYYIFIKGSHSVGLDRLVDNLV